MAETVTAEKIRHFRTPIAVGRAAICAARDVGGRATGEIAAARTAAARISSLRRDGESEAVVYDKQRVEDTVLALMHLNAHKSKFGWRAWKSFPWEATDGLHERELISDPRSKAKSVMLTEEGARLAEQLFTEMFGTDDTEAG